MRLAVTDANIFIDLIHIEFHGHLFALDFEVHTSFEIFDELDEVQQKQLQPFIVQTQLTLHDCGGIAPIESLKSIKALSDSDKTVLYLANHLEAFVLSGGNGVGIKVGSIQKIEIHGIFWLLDHFLDKKLVTRKHASQQLRKLMDYNKHLPAHECEQRLAAWEQ